MSERLVIAKEPRRAAALGHQHIEIAIAIDVGIGGTATHNRLGELLTDDAFGHPYKLVARFGTGVPKKLRRLTILLARHHLVDVVLQMAVGREYVQSAIEIV